LSSRVHPGDGIFYGFDSISHLSLSRQCEAEGRSAARLVLRPNLPVVFCDDPLGDGKPKTCALGFAERGKRFKKAIHDLSGNALTGVRDFCRDVLLRRLEPKDDLAPARHGLCRVDK
jgi:hypothetical protein